MTAYYGERDRAGDRFVADALAGIFTRHELQTSLVLRGVSGFGAKQHLRTDRQLTLSEDLPVVSVAVDTRAKIEAALAETAGIRFDGLVTLERARLITSALEGVTFPAERGAETKLTIYLGRQERAGGRPAYEAAVDVLHSAGVAGATVLLGVDGTARGVRRRARFFGRNAEVPLMIISVGDSARLAGAVAALEQLLARPLATLENIQVCKRDGELLAEPDTPPARDPAIRQKLMVYASEQAQHAGRPLYFELVRRLRAAGAAGATCLRGIWGYHGDHQPHGDLFWQLQRRVPIVTITVDTPERTRAWFEIVDELTAETGLVTSEMVPALIR